MLGEKGLSGDPRASILTCIHNATIAAERERIHEDHPGEEEATLNNRVLGALEPTRGASYLDLTVANSLILCMIIVANDTQPSVITLSSYPQFIQKGFS